MAGVDALLNLLVAQGAEVLTLARGAAPALIKGGERRDLSMPPLQVSIFERFVEEVREAQADGTYRLDSKEGVVAFLVAIEDGSMEFRLADASPTPTLPTTERRSAAPDGALSSLVERALHAEAIDLFLSTSTDARMRVARDLEELPGTRCDAAELLDFLGLADEDRARLEGHGSVDLSIGFPAGRVRVNVFRHQEGIAAVLRPIQRRIRSLPELGLPADLHGLVEYTDGLVLMVGPTGSGKSSTLAALIDHLNRTRARHVVTIEDPVEFAYEPLSCLIHQREVGRHVESFAAGLRAALREAPDVILLGEMRDPETIAAALTAAETGHLVLSTLHSGNAAMAIDRIIDAFSPHQQGQVRWQLAGTLRAVVTQMLLPATRTGRLVPAIEKMIVTHAVAASIREGRGHQIESQIQTGRNEGMVSLEIALADLVSRGEISQETATSSARNPSLLRELLRSV